MKKYVELSLFSDEELQCAPTSSSNMATDNTVANNEAYDLSGLFKRLSKSAFRSRFHLTKKDKEYIAQKGLATIRKHAADFVTTRLAPATIPNDGKQTPMKGHPVF